MTDRNRRTFLKGVGVTAGAAGLGSVSALVADAQADGSTAGWPTFQNDAANSGSTDAAVDVDYPMAAAEASLDLEDGARPAVVDGVAYVARRDEFVAVDLESDSVTWGTTYSAAESAIGADLSPTVAGDRVIVSGGGVVTALSRSDGGVLWQFGTGSQDSSSTTVADDTVYVATDTGRCHAISLEDGSERWTHETAGDVNTYKLFGVPAVADGTVFVSTSAGVYALEAGSGEQQWTGPSSEFPPVVSGDLVYLVQGNDVLGVDRATGEERWRAAGEYDVRSTPVVADGRVFVRRYRSTVHAFDAADGTELWSTDAGEDTYKQLIVAGDTLYVPSTYDRYQQLVALDVSSGEVRWRYYTPGMEVEEPVGAYVADGSLYFLGHYKDLFELVEGPRSFRWRMDLTEAPTSTTGQPADAPPVASPWGVYVSHPTDREHAIRAIEDGKGGTHWTAEAGSTLEANETGLYAVSDQVVHAFDYVETDDLYQGERERWMGSVSKPVSTPPLATDDRVFVGSERRDMKASVYALDAESGDELWEYSGETCPGLATVTGGPAPLGEHVLAGTEDALWALSRTDGAVGWRDARPADSLTTNDDRAFAAAGGTLRALSADGTEQWTAPSDGTVEALEADDSRVYALEAIGDATALVAYDADDGSRLWTYADTDADELTVPRVTANAVYLAGGTTVRAVDPAGGSEVRVYDVGETISQPPAVSDDVVYATTEDGEVYAFDRTE